MSWQYSDSWKGSDLPFMQNNAVEFYGYFNNIGYSLNAISGMLGNIEKESAINPHSKELPVSSWTEDKGYGLVGWTPATKLINWCTGRGLTYTDGDAQCSMISSNEDGLGSAAWGNSSDPHAPSRVPPITWEEFKTSELTADTLALYFMYYYEKPDYTATEQTKAFRSQQALYWYEYLGGVVPPTPPTRKKKMPLYMMCRPIVRKF